MRSLLILFLFISGNVLAQQTSIGVFAEPSFQFSSFMKSDHPSTDSLEQIMERDLGIYAGIEIGFHLDRFNTINLKPGFYQGGFALVREGLQLFDLIHPAVGEIRDLSQAATKIANFHHRFQYLSLEAEYALDVSPRTQNLPVKFGLHTGLGFHYLMSQDIMLRTEGFAIDGNFKTRITDSLFFNARPFLATFHIAGEMNYEALPGFLVYAQIRARTALMSSTTNDPRVFIWTPGAQVGLRKFL